MELHGWTIWRTKLTLGKSLDVFVHRIHLSKGEDSDSVFIPAISHFLSDGKAKNGGRLSESKEKHENQSDSGKA